MTGIIPRGVYTTTMLELALIILFVIFMLYQLDAIGKLRLWMLAKRAESYCDRTNAVLADTRRLQASAVANWEQAAAAQPLNFDQETERARQLNCIWDSIRHVEEIQTRNASCKAALDEMRKHYPALGFNNSTNDKIIVDLIARDVDIQGWSVDGLCGGTTTQWW